MPINISKRLPEVRAGYIYAVHASKYRCVVQSMLSMLPMSVRGYLNVRKTSGREWTARTVRGYNWSTTMRDYTLLDVDRIRTDNWPVVAAAL